MFNEDDADLIECRLVNRRCHVPQVLRSKANWTQRSIVASDIDNPPNFENSERVASATNGVTAEGAVERGTEMIATAS